MITLGLKLKSAVAIAVGSIAWTLVMIKSGWVYTYGMGFWGPNGHDGVWHISLASSLARGSWEMPIFAGNRIQNYHVGFDLILAALKTVSHLPMANIYFQLLPPILAVATGICVYKFVLSWRKSENEAFWAVVFTYFATSFGWLVSLGRYRDIGGESMFWAQQSISTLINPPFALSLIFLLLGLICLSKGKKLPAILFFGLLAQVKVYAALLGLGGLLVAGVYEWWKTKRTNYLQVLAGSAILGALIFFPINRSSSNVIVWKPFWFLETMMAVSDRANWPKYYEAMINYRAAHNLVKGIPAYAIAFAIFVIGNLGLRVLALGEMVKWLKSKISPIEIFLASLIAAGFLLPMFILQVGTPWNTIQFTYYSLIFSGILAGIYVSRFKIQYSLFIFLILTVPGVWGTLKQYLPSRPPAMISTKELEALNFLAHQASGTVLTPVYDPQAARAAENNPPRPLYLYESTAYVSAFSDHPVYLEDQVNLNITDYAWQDRSQRAGEFFETLDKTLANDFLHESKIKYIYLPQIYKIRPKIGQAELGAKTIFDNYEAAIWEIE